jgi:hypothetical protein
MLESLQESWKLTGAKTGSLDAISGFMNLLEQGWPENEEMARGSWLRAKGRVNNLEHMI